MMGVVFTAALYTLTFPPLRLPKVIGRLIAVLLIAVTKVASFLEVGDANCAPLSYGGTCPTDPCCVSPAGNGTTPPIGSGVETSGW